MPALDLLPKLTATLRDQYEAARQNAEKLALRLPLVRVVLSRDPVRRVDEIADVFERGHLRTEHRGKGTRSIEAALGVGPFLYFHGGRTHPTYGDAVFVIADADGVEATPFGLGGLCCDGPGTSLHDQRSCVSPIAHEEVGTQSDFVRASTWTTDWRANASDYLALYFATDLRTYFSESSSSKPSISDPELVYDDSGNEDWRAWTIEIRARVDVNLFDHARAKRILWWGIPDWLEDTIFHRTLTERRTREELYPLLAQLQSDRQISVTDPLGITDFRAVDTQIQEFLFSELE